MKKTRSSAVALLLIGAAMILIGGTLNLAYAQTADSLQQIKSLYASAAYEDALSVIARAQAGGRRAEYEQYRVFCLVALGRTAEAEKAIASVVQADPSFVPDAREMSPRIRELFTRTRKAMVPEIAHGLYVEAREALDRKDKLAATAKFEAVVRLIDSAVGSNDANAGDKGKADDADEPLLFELRLLASGFLDLSRATEARAETKPAAARQPSAAPSIDITAPTPIRQELPAWTPPEQMMRREFRGALRVFISEVGRVTDAELSPGIHPAYDRLLLAAAKTWQYQPALRNGSPVASEKLIEVVLKPR
jgi:tetratricopeptide (TPR) repeat protein